MKYLLLASPFPVLMSTLSLYVYTLGLTISLIVFIIFIFDAYKRSIDFINARKEIDRFGIKAGRKYRFSMCQRHAFMAACLSKGMFKQSLELYKDMGYKFYHIFPDQGLLNLSFWKSFFLGKG